MSETTNSWMDLFTFDSRQLASFAAAADGWTVIDMAADWSTIYAPEH